MAELKTKIGRSEFFDWIAYWQLVAEEEKKAYEEAHAKAQSPGSSNSRNTRITF